MKKRRLIRKTNKGKNKKGITFEFIIKILMWTVLFGIVAFAITHILKTMGIIK